jgi:hypothetical protein
VPAAGFRVESRAVAGPQKPRDHRPSMTDAVQRCQPIVRYDRAEGVRCRRQEARHQSRPREVASQSRESFLPLRVLADSRRLPVPSERRSCGFRRLIRRDIAARPTAPAAEPEWPRSGRRRSQSACHRFRQSPALASDPPARPEIQHSPIQLALPAACGQRQRQAAAGARRATLARRSERCSMRTATKRKVIPSGRVR